MTDTTMENSNPDQPSQTMTFAPATFTFAPGPDDSIAQDSLHDRLLLLTSSERDDANDVLLIFCYVSIAISVPLTAVNILVFAQRDMRSATSVYVIGLSVAQLIYVVGFAGLLVLGGTLENAGSSLVYWAYFMYVGVYVSVVVRRGSYVVMSLVSLERLYAIVRPFHVQALFLSKHPVVCLLTAYGVTALCHVYVLARTVVVGEEDPETGTVKYKPVRTSLYYQHQHINDGFSLAAKILLTYVALGVQIFLNVSTVWALKRHNTATKRVQSSVTDDVKAKRERQLTVTILAATVSYVILSLPYAFHNLFHTVYAEYKPFGLYTNLYSVVGNFVYNLTLLSCAVDFVCFLALSSNYRKTLFGLVGYRKVRSGGEGSANGKRGKMGVSCTESSLVLGGVTG